MNCQSQGFFCDGFTATGNFDGDQEGEVLITRAGVLYFVTHDGTPMLHPTTMTPVTVAIPIDNCSRNEGGPPTVADFDGDGKAEVVYNDEQLFRIFDGTTGMVLTQISRRQWAATTNATRTTTSPTAPSRAPTSRSQTPHVGLRRRIYTYISREPRAIQPDPIVSMGTCALRVNPLVSTHRERIFPKSVRLKVKRWSNPVVTRRND